MTTEFLKWRPHPWHGLSPGPDAPDTVSVFVEITPFDTVKYEIDKYSGFLKVDRPQYSSSLPPSVYGFIPQTYCGRRVGEKMPDAEDGDHDPLDVCVISSHAITHSEILLTARVIGGIPMLDNRRADDKIIAVLQGDAVYDSIQNLTGLPEALIDQLRHYFATYKRVGKQNSNVRVDEPYDRVRALDIVTAAIEDYSDAYGEDRLP